MQDSNKVRQSQPPEFSVPREITVHQFGSPDWSNGWNVLSIAGSDVSEDEKKVGWLGIGVDGTFFFRFEDGRSYAIKPATLVNFMLTHFGDPATCPRLEGEEIDA